MYLTSPCSTVQIPLRKIVYSKCLGENTENYSSRFLLNAPSMTIKSDQYEYFSERKLRASLKSANVEVINWVNVG